MGTGDLELTVALETPWSILILKSQKSTKT